MSLFDSSKVEDLIRQRILSLDRWLVTVCEMLASGVWNNNSNVRRVIIEFVTTSDANIIPCERENYVEGDLGLYEDDEDIRESIGSNSSATKSSPFATFNQSFLPNPLTQTLGSSIRQACYTLKHLTGPSALSSDRSIPLDLLRQAKGLAFLTVIKGGMFLSARIGTGLLISRMPDIYGEGKQLWSAPVSLATAGMGWGALIGGDITSYMIVLNTVAGGK